MLQISHKITLILCKILFNTKACELFNNFWRSLNNLQCNEFMLGHLKGETTILYSLYMYVFSLKLQSFERALYIWVFSARIKKLPDCKYLAKASSVALKSAFFVFGFKLLRLKILLLNFKFMIYIYCELWWLITNGKEWLAVTVDNSWLIVVNNNCWQYGKNSWQWSLATINNGE